MPETKQITFAHKEIAEALVRLKDIHEGLWGVYLEFGIAGANVVNSADNTLTPAAVVPVLKIGIQRFPESNSLTVDAAEVNPLAGEASSLSATTEDQSPSA
jgi:hypothetical protein